MGLNLLFIPQAFNCTNRRAAGAAGGGARVDFTEVCRSVDSGIQTALWRTHRECMHTDSKYNIL